MDTKSIFQSKTFWLNLIVFVLVILTLPQFVALLPAAALPYIALLGAIGNAALRTFFPSQQPVSLLGGRRTGFFGRRCR